MDIQDFSFVVVGSGLLGSVVAERIASQLDEKVLVIEQREHTGGNCHSATDADTGIEYHQYGTHIFHTSNERVWNYITRFTSFNDYRHRVLSQYKDRLYTFPINLNTISEFYQVDLSPEEVPAFLAARTDQEISEPANFEEQAISQLGTELYEAFFRHYTIKQWQIDPRELPVSIFNRLPYRNDRRQDYFNDRWQGIPQNGYAALFDKLLAHRNISVMLNTDFFSIRDRISKKAMLIYSGPIDRFFDYKFGRLSWRTLRFEKEIVPTGNYQDIPVINYPEPHFGYTRIHEPRHLHPDRPYPADRSLIFREYSLPDDGAAPYYPILSAGNREILERYRQEAAGLHNTFISGRLGDYKYYDMHQTIDRALEIFENGILPKIRLQHDHQQ